MNRQRGLSVRLKLTLSYAGFLMVAGFLMLAAAWLTGRPEQPFGVLLRSVDGVISTLGGLVPGHSSMLLRAYAPAAAITLAFLLVFGLVGGWLLAGRMLVPLARLTDATRTAANGSLSHRVRLSGRSDEFRELADAFDTITQTLLDVARNDPNRDAGELVDRLNVINTRAIDLTEALLLLSRADQRSFTRGPVDLSLIAEEATETPLPFAEKRGLTIETSGDVTPTIGSHALLLQMTTNLVHNAIVHNLPERGTVWVTTSVQPRTVALTVENTGETLAPQLVSTLIEPFQRGVERIRSDDAGVGLGLAIVKSIAQAHNGVLTLTPRGAGGLCVSVQLPAAPLS